MSSQWTRPGSQGAKRLRIAVDAMGGDKAPGEIVQGALDAAREYGIEVVLVGPKDRISAEVQRRGGVPGITIRHAPDIIGNDEAPVAAVRRKKQSTVVVGMELVRQGQADGFLSAGSTGALLAGGVFVLGRLKGIDRPAYGVALPTRKGGSVLLLDTGLSVDNRPEHLLQFAVMGHVYAQHVLGVTAPRVALLNNGAEADKGNAVTKAAYELLNQTQGLGFVGNIEGRDIPAGVADVVIADGFVGNITLKVFEGVALALLGMVKDALTSSPMAKLGAMLARPALKRLAKKLDYAETGGAPILGLVAPVVKCHGSSNARAIKNGIGVLRNLIAGRSAERVAAGLDQVKHLLPKRTRKGDTTEDV